MLHWGNMEESKKFRIPIVEVASKTDVILLMLRIEEGSRRIIKRLKGEDPEIVKIATSLFNTQQFAIINNKLNEELDKLTSESEILIDSPNANTP